MGDKLSRRSSRASTSVSGEICQKQATPLWGTAREWRRDVRIFRIGRKAKRNVSRRSALKQAEHMSPGDRPTSYDFEAPTCYSWELLEFQNFVAVQAKRRPLVPWQDLPLRAMSTEPIIARICASTPHFTTIPALSAHVWEMFRSGPCYETSSRQCAVPSKRAKNIEVCLGAFDMFMCTSGAWPTQMHDHARLPGAIKKRHLSIFDHVWVCLNKFGFFPLGISQHIWSRLRVCFAKLDRLRPRFARTLRNSGRGLGKCLPNLARYWPSFMRM